MLVIMLFCFAAIVYALEYDDEVQNCHRHWLARGISKDFLEMNYGGVVWGCDACLSVQNELSCYDAAGNCSNQRMQCDTCDGFPPGHVECAGLPVAQRFQNQYQAMWFMLVTVSTVGYGDMTPRKESARAFCMICILAGIIFIAMPINIVGRTFSAIWDARSEVKL